MESTWIKEDIYKILGVEYGATEADIRLAFRKKTLVRLLWFPEGWI